MSLPLLLAKYSLSLSLSLTIYLSISSLLMAYGFEDLININMLYVSLLCHYVCIILCIIYITCTLHTTMYVVSILFDISF